MIRIRDRIARVGNGFKCGAMQDVIYTERGKFPDVSVPEATSLFYKAVGHAVGKRVIGIRKRGIVKITAYNHRIR